MSLTDKQYQRAERCGLYSVWVSDPSPDATAEAIAVEQTLYDAKQAGDRAAITWPGKWISICHHVGDAMVHAGLDDQIVNVYYNRHDDGSWHRVNV